MLDKGFNPVRLGFVTSTSNPAKQYEIRMGKDGRIYCGCPAWKFSGAEGVNKSCKHVRAFVARSL
jgi:hypothetical protein